MFEPSISLSSFVETSTLLGYPLESRGGIQQQQDEGLLHKLQQSTQSKLTNSAQKRLFYLGAFDILPYYENGILQFQPIELNGMGFSGITNIASSSLKEVLNTFSEVPLYAPPEPGLTIVAYSGKESTMNPKPNSLFYEKILIADAIKKGFQNPSTPIRIIPFEKLDPQNVSVDDSTIVMGYIKELLPHVHVKNRQLYLYNHPVRIMTHDRFCLNIFSRFKELLSSPDLYSINQSFMISSDKGIFYTLLNEFMMEHTFSSLPSHTPFVRTSTREELIESVQVFLEQEQWVVIKPQGTALGHGIEFFRNTDSLEEILHKINRTLDLTEKFYACPGGAFPYTVMKFIDACTLEDVNHSLFRHKYELRIVVYREGELIKACPSIVKFSNQKFDAFAVERLMLINNVTASAGKKQTEGSEFVLPLCNQETLDLLNISLEQLEELCLFTTQFVQYLLKRCHESPEWFSPQNWVKNVPV